MTTYRNTPVGQITAVCVGEMPGTWIVHRRLPDGVRSFPPGEVVDEWTAEMAAWMAARG